jgi:TolA-binding protein
MSVAALHERATLHERVTANAVHASHSPTAAASAVFAPVPEPEAPKALAPAPETAPPAAPLTSPSASARRPIPTHALTAPPVHEELVVLGRASAVLNSGDAAKALSILDTYDARFPHAAMAQEATVLRIESLARMGNAEAARCAGDAFIKENPDTPYAARIRSVIGTNP